MQQIKISHFKQNLDVLKIATDLASRHPQLKLTEIFDTFDIMRIRDEDKHTQSDAILARTHMKLHELSRCSLKQ